MLDDFRNCLRVFSHQHVEGIVLDALHNVFYLGGFRHVRIKATAEAYDVLNVGRETLSRQLGAIPQALFCTELAHCRSAKHVREGGLESGPVGKLGFVVVEPELCYSSEVKVDAAQFVVFVPPVVDAYSFERREPVLDVLLIGAVEDVWISLSRDAGTVDRWRCRSRLLCSVDGHC